MKGLITLVQDKDIAEVLFSETQIKAKVAELGRMISQEYADKNPLIVGVMKGAFVFTADLVRSIDCPVQMDFIIAKSYGNGSTTSGSVKIIKDLENDIFGRHVILVEDIIDSGVTMSKLIPMLQTRHAASIRLCALLSKPSRRIQEVNIDYCGWEIPDHFVVGYGLDFAEKYRNLPYIGVLKPEIYA